MAAQHRSSASTRPASEGARVLPRRPLSAAFVAVGFTVLLYLVELVDVILPADLDQAGIESRTLDGLDGIVWSPLLHAGWAHLAGNTIPVLVFAFLTMAAGFARWLLVTAIVWVVGGLGVWLTGPSGAVTIGASGLAFGWLAFLLLRGVFHRSVAQLAVGVLLLVLWGGMLAGVLPGAAGVSWQAHLFGALAGIVAAWVSARVDRKRSRARATGGSTASPGSLGA